MALLSQIQAAALIFFKEEEKRVSRELPRFIPLKGGIAVTEPGNFNSHTAPICKQAEDPVL